jgi:hypothetical protein
MAVSTRRAKSREAQQEETGLRMQLVGEATIAIYTGERIEVLCQAPEDTPTPQPTATATATPVPTATNTPLPTATQTPLPTATQTPQPTATATATPEPGVLIIDDTDPGFSTLAEQDAWGVFEGTAEQFYRGGHHFNREIGTGQDVATWGFAVPEPGRYEVFAWWYQSYWRPTDVPYTIHHEAGTDTVRVNQQINGGQWNSLGVYDFQFQGSVWVSDDVSSGRGIIADAIRLVHVGPRTPPTPTGTPAPTITATPAATSTSTPISVPSPTPTSTPTPVPGGQVRYVSPGANLSSAVSQLGPGDTLILRDGVYWSSMSVSVSGTASQPIVIRAEHDGRAVVDGQMARAPLRVSGRYVIIEGIRFQNGSGSTVVVNGQHVTLRRVSAYTSGDGNVHVYEIAYTSDVLLEDCAASGKGRNLYLLYESDRVILRRCWGNWMARNGTGEANEWAQFYATNDCRIEYGVGTFDDQASVRNVLPVAYWIASWNASGTTNNRNVLDSSLYYGYPYHNGVWTGTQGQEQRDNAMRNNVIVSSEGYTEIFQRGGQNFVIEDNTFVNNGLSWATIRWDSGTSSVLRGNSFVGGVALTGSIPSARNDNNYWVDNVGAGLGTGSTTINPNYNTERYGIGGYLMRPPGFTSGAEILYDGEGNRLWPWPMEARICAETAQLFGGGRDGRSVTYEAHQIQYDLDGDGQSETYNCSGGVWRTLEDVY